MGRSAVFARGSLLGSVSPPSVGTASRGSTQTGGSSYVDALPAVTHLELVGRLALAALLGASLGIEREARGKVAGLRTHALVGVGAALFTISGSHGFQGSASDPDPTRVAAQVATGIGFIGAGAIIRTGGSVRGLTTAATLWLAASLGVSSAAGLYIESVAAAMIVMVLIVAMRLCKPLMARRHRRLIIVHYEEGRGVLAHLLQGLRDLGADIRDIQITDGPAEGTRSVNIDVVASDDELLDQLVHTVNASPGVRWARWCSSVTGRSVNATTLATEFAASKRNP